MQYTPHSQSVSLKKIYVQFTYSLPFVTKGEMGLEEDFKMTAQIKTIATPPNIAPPIFYEQEACPIRNVLQQHLGKWPILTLTHLSFGQHRFTELLHGIPDISQRMLTQTLRNLEKDGLISRTVTPSIPPRVDYDLTPLGNTILPTLESLLEWGATHRKEIEYNRER